MVLRVSFCRYVVELLLFTHYHNVIRPIKGVDDYSVYVRNPIDIGTLTNKIESLKYNSFAEFVEDFRLVFKNAKTYNVVHKDNDSTGTSAQIYNKAVQLEQQV